MDGVLDSVSVPICAAFNKYGTVLAVGCNDGTIVFWDFLTRGIIKIIPAHVHPISSIMWSRSNYQVLTGSTDKFASIWDPVGGNRLEKYEFSSEVIRAEYNPRCDQQIMISLMKETPVLIEIGVKFQKIPVYDANDFSLIAKFDAKGLNIFTGNMFGEVIVFNALDMDVVASFKIEGGSIKSLEFARRGGYVIKYLKLIKYHTLQFFRSFLINSADKQIRVYDTEEIIHCGINSNPKPNIRIHESINNPRWKKCCFSADGEYICGGSVRQNALHIWDKTFGSIIKILYRKKDDYLLDIIWHPTQPILVSIGSGCLTIWTPNRLHQDWSNYLPNFVEIDKCIDYDERESEYDIDDEDISSEKINLDIDTNDVEDDDDEDVEIDVVSFDPVPIYCSTDEDDDGANDIIYKMPISVSECDDDDDEN